MFCDTYFLIESSYLKKYIILMHFDYRDFYDFYDFKLFFNFHKFYIYNSR